MAALLWAIVTVTGALIRHCLLQPGKCLYTSIRELVENSLDAAESIGQLPDIAITM